MKKLQKEIHRLEQELAQERLKNNQSNSDLLQLKINERESQFLTSSKSSKENQKGRRRTWCPSMSRSPLRDLKSMTQPLCNVRLDNDVDDDLIFCDAKAIFNDENHLSENVRLMQGISSVSNQRGSTLTVNKNHNSCMTPRSLSRMISTPRQLKIRRSFNTLNYESEKNLIEGELAELEDFDYLETHIGPAMPVTPNDEIRLLRGQLFIALDLVEKYKQNNQTMAIQALDSTPRKPILLNLNRSADDIMIKYK